jgi:hypothetical protein
MKEHGPAFIPTMLFEIGTVPDAPSVDWVRRHPFVQEVLAEFKGRKRPWRLESVVQLLALHRYLTRHRPGAVGADLKREVMRAGKGLAACAALLQGPASWLAPSERDNLRRGLLTAVNSLAVFYDLSKRGNWKDLIRAQITVALRTGLRGHNDRAVGELIGIIEGSGPGRRGTRSRRSAQDRRSDEGVWRRRQAASQKQWRLRHGDLMAAVQQSRTRAALEPLSEFSADTDWPDGTEADSAPRTKKIGR